MQTEVSQVDGPVAKIASGQKYCDVNERDYVANPFPICTFKLSKLEDRIVVRNMFPGYYAPSEAELDHAWKHGLIVIDTNALLDVYRLPPKMSEEFMSALDFFKDRLWIPHHVGLEFQRNRFNAVSGQQKKTNAAMQEAETYLKKLKLLVQDLQLDQHGIDLNVDSVLANVSVETNKLVQAITQAKTNEPQISATDTVRDRLGELFEGRIGPAPKDRTELESLVKEADFRFENKIPPGFRDEKTKDQSTFIHNGILYANKFGDLIIWRQIIAHLKETKMSHILVVTGDKKEDWWWKDTQGRVFGPHQELVHELHRETDIQVFWMYSPDQFLSRSASYTKQSVSQETLTELTKIERENLSPENDDSVSDTGIGSVFLDATITPKRPEALTTRLVQHWLQQYFEEVNPSKTTDLICTIDEKITYVEIFKLATWSGRLPTRLFDIAERLQDHFEEENQDHTMIVLLIRKSTLAEIREKTGEEKFKAQLQRMRELYSISTIVVGGFRVSDSSFKPIFTIGSPV